MGGIMILLVIIDLFAALGRNTPPPASNNENTSTIPQINSTVTFHPYQKPLSIISTYYILMTENSKKSL
jgi:hypothetical protein